MRKKAILIPILTIVAALTLIRAITWASSAQPAETASIRQVQLLDVQKQVVLDAISQKDIAKADAALNQMVRQFSRHENIAQAVYSVARDYGKLSRDKGLQIHQFNVSNYPENIYAMWSQVEIFKTHYDTGESQAADTDVKTLVETFGAQPTLPKELYKIAGKYNFAGKRTKANELYAIAAKDPTDNIYVQLSQLFCDAQKNDITSAGYHLSSLLENQADNSKLAEEIYNAAVNFGYADEHEYAIQFYQQILDTWPDASQAPYALQRMAIEYSKLGDDDNARRSIDKLIADYNDFPKKAETFWKLGQYYREDARMYDQAAEYYGYAANNSPKDDDYTMFCQVELVKYYIRTGDLAKGDEQYNKLTTEFAKNPNLASNICFIGDTYLRAADIDTANLLYNRVLTTWPDDPQTIFAKAGFAKVAANLGRDGEVNQIIDEIFADYADNPDIASAIFGIGEHYWNMASEEHKNHPRSYNRKPPLFILESSDTAKEEFRIARSIWERSINELPDSETKAKDYLFAAESSRYLEDYDKALEYYQKIVDTWPDFESAWVAQSRIGEIYEEFK